MLAANGKVFQHHLRQGEVDQDIELIQDLFQATGHRDADTPQGCQLTRISTDQRTVGPDDSGCQPRERRALLHRIVTRLAHAPGSAHRSYHTPALSFPAAEHATTALQTTRGFTGWAYGLPN